MFQLTRYMPNLVDILLLQQLPILQPRLILKVMRLHPRMCEQKRRILQVLHPLDIRVQSAKRHLPLIPRRGCGVGDTRVLGHETLVVRIDMISTLIFRQKIDKLVESVGEQICCTAGKIGPVQFEVSHDEDASEDEAAHALWVRLRIGERERRAPGAAEDHVPLADRQVLAQSLDVGD